MAALLGELRRDEPSLQELDLAFRELTDRDFVELMAAMRGNTHVRHADLGDNPALSLGLVAAKDQKAGNGLSAAEQRTGDVAFEALKTMLRRSSSLEKVRLVNTRFGSTPKSGKRAKQRKQGLVDVLKEARCDREIAKVRQAAAGKQRLILHRVTAIFNSLSVIESWSKVLGKDCCKYRNQQTFSYAKLRSHIDILLRRAPKGSP